jgi:hypothetical protein
MVHPNSGFYEKDQHEYVSVSEILAKTSELFDENKLKGLEIWRSMEPDWQNIMQRAQRRGTIIHSEIELSLLGDCDKHKIDHPTMDEILEYNIHEYVTHLSPLLDQIKKENFKHGLSSPLFLMEEEMYCERLGHAGTPDVRLTWDHKYSVWDWKSVRSYKEEGVRKKAKSMSQYKGAMIQIGAYALGHNLEVKAGRLDRPIEQGVICVCYDWREPHVHVLDKDELKAAAQEFIERLKAYCSLHNTHFPRLITPEI